MADEPAPLGPTPPGWALGTRLLHRIYQDAILYQHPGWSRDHATWTSALNDAGFLIFLDQICQINAHAIGLSLHPDIMAGMAANAAEYERMLHMHP